MQKSKRSFILRIFAVTAVLGSGSYAMTPLIAEEVQVDDVPRSNIPLPLVSRDSEKPWSGKNLTTSATFAPDWQIGLRHPVHEAQKPASLPGVSAITCPESEHVQADMTGHLSRALRVEGNPLTGGEESGSSEVNQKLTKIAWKTESAILREDDSLDTIPIGATSSIELHAASTHWADLAALGRLSSQVASSSRASGYSTDALQQLLTRGSGDWLHAKPEAFESELAEQHSEPSPAYVQELQSLRNRIVLAEAKSRTASGQTIEEGRAASVPEILNDKSMESPASDEKLLVGNGATFANLSQIRLGGPSTAGQTDNFKLSPPPALAEVKRYSNKYAPIKVPTYYLVNGQFGVSRPNRNTFPFYHNPLYFEEANLERCGQSHGCLTTAASAVHFAANLSFLPYHAAVQCPDSGVRSLLDCPTYDRFETHQ